ncbi:MAG: rhomboid family protein [Verrucomicrobium sp.]
MASSSTLCLNHPLREAAARCTSCGQPFCRECITDLEGRMVCVACHRAKTLVQEKPKRDWFIVTAGLQAAVGLSLLWLTAWLVGRTLLNLPAEIHEGTIWTKMGNM